MRAKELRKARPWVSRILYACAHVTESNATPASPHISEIRTPDVDTADATSQSKYIYLCVEERDIDCPLAARQ
jgi:hypothetical protein